MAYDRWHIADPIAADALGPAGYGPLAAITLARRGYVSPEAVAAFLKMGPELLHDPFLLPGMREAAARIALAAERGETVAVYGDYDADGVTATCVMVSALQGLGIRCLWRIPDRERDGYGLNSGAVEDFYNQGVTLLITVDTGVTATKEVEAANRRGIDVIVTDHHECRDELPPALAVINPRRADSEYPFTGLAGVGVAFKLACAVTGDWRGSLIRFADIVALGTIADIMPVTGENRLLITQGLRAMAVTRNAGLRALLDETGGGPVTADTVAYTLAPHINAAGRVGRADTAVELLLAADPRRAQELARTLCELNGLRRARENVIMGEALASIDGTAPALVAAGENWPTGMAGIVAARLADRYERPVFILCLEGELARGSARSVPGVHLVELLKNLSHLLEDYGGHELAAGFSLRRDNVGTFRQAVERACADAARREAVLEVDAEVRPEWLALDSLRELEGLAPFGAGFAPPVFCLRNVSVASVTPIGGGKHIRVVFDGGGARLGAVWFHQTALPASPYLDVAFRAEINRFRGQEQAQLRIIDVRVSQGA